MSKKNLSRRSFLKGAAASALGLAAIPALGLAEEKAAYIPGTYSAVVKAYGGFITATLTFSETAITDCVIDAACETPSIGGVAAEEIAKAVLAEQKADVVSSASAAITVPAVKKAVNNCIAQAMGLAAALNEKGADEGDDWLGQAPEIDDAQIASVQDTDLLIIGAGNGGMMAAATAADAGMNFILTEQNAVMGDTRHWIGAVDTKQMQEAGVEVKKDRLLNEIARYASYKCDMDLIKMWIQNSGEMIAYLESLGWSVSADPLAVEELLIPEAFDDSYQDYLALQSSQGFDLSAYCGKRVKRYTYEITNYPTGETGVQAALLVYKNKIIGGEVLSTSPDGFIHGLEMPKR